MYVSFINVYFASQQPNQDVQTMTMLQMKDVDKEYSKFKKNLFFLTSNKK